MGEENSEPPAAAPAATFIEVTCRSTGKTVRFAAGTDAGFAVSLINRKLKGLNQLATHIEAVKDGEQEEEEETIAFGPTAILSNFGENWKLQTVLSFEERINGGIHGMAKQTPKDVSGDESRVPNQISSLYIVKTIFAFILIFVLAAIFTLFLDNLPELIVFVKSII
ncbi:uncharacterized protein [Cicer arietinum]|uniref:Uncharacterized protein LOC101492602 n=1 Tax=Cicer arietinum TaxID=3827 RepID=A0A1S2XKJ9_CICAR|nr:uncharacterized protein LOC101492602 [Cicer arietinum]